MPTPLSAALVVYPGLRVAVLVLLLGACARPAVDVPEVPGDPGEVCVTTADCGGSLTCVEHCDTPGSCGGGSCCGDPHCSATCESLLEKDGTVLGAALQRHPQKERFFRRKCVAVCCQGKSAAEIENVIGAWSRGIPAHGSHVGTNAPH